MCMRDWLNLIAIIVAPIAAVLIGQWLQDRSEKRKDKMQTFKVLMTSRIHGWTPESVYALNIIDIVFADDDKVRAAWKDLYDKYCVVDPDEMHLEKIKQAQYKLLETIASSLGYKSKITWETIQNPYIPKGMADQIAIQTRSQQAYSELLSNMNKVFPSTQQPMAEHKEDIQHADA